MHRASNAFSVLQATAAIVAMAIVLWSLGLSSIRFAEAANVTSFSDTLSTAAPSVAANHTLTFTTPSGVANGSTITIDFGGNFTGTSSIVGTDIDVATTSDFSVGDSCGAVDVAASWSGDVLTLTMCVANSKSIPANGTTTIEIGTNATFGATGANQLTNPAVGSHEILLTAGADSGATRVAIVSNVTVTASVATLFQFTVAGVATGGTVNGTTTTGSTTATSIPFGKLEAGVASTAAQQLSVVTNAKNGFVVTVTSDGQLVSATGADIDGYRNGNYDTTSVQWTSPAATIGQEQTYGHWGITSDDSTLGATLASDLYDVAGNGQNYVSASTTPVEVFRHDGPTNGLTTGQGTTKVGYTVEISALQEAATDYQATLTYVATPVF